MKMVDILRKFVRAERIGNWALHLEAVSEMLPYLAASGHNLYTKSARLYVQRMSKLNNEHPDGQATVVFDGYDGTSTKNTTHQRRTGGNAGATVTFDEDMQVTMKKEQFLANKTNKQHFINMLSTKLRAQNCQTHHAAGDADLLIVQNTSCM